MVLNVHARACGVSWFISKDRGSTAFNETVQGKDPCLCGLVQVLGLQVEMTIYIFETTGCEII